MQFHPLHQAQQRHRVHRGIHFIRVQGDYVQRARSHMSLLRKEIQDGAVLALAKKNEWLIRRGAGVIQLPPIQAAIVRFYQKVVVPLLGARMTAEESGALRAAVEETGISYENWRETLFQADALMVLARLTMMKHLLPEWIPGGLPGCSSAVALKDWTESGRLLACRNFDYFIVGPWEKYPTVIFHEPTEADCVPYVSLTTAGVHTAGVTSINREGLTLFTHAHFGKSISFQGRSIVLLGDEIIRKAKTIDQAVDIARKNQTCANWAFVISSAKENQAVVIEMTPGKVRVRGTQDGFIAHTNYFHNQELRKQEALLCGSYCEDLKSRICQIRERLEPFRGKLKPSHMSVTLGDHRDYFSGIERVFGNTLSVVTTVKSAVFDPGAQKFWMASRHESPVGLGEYIEVDLDRFWKQSPEEYEHSMSVLPPYQPQTPGLIEGVHHYREAYRAYHTDNHEPDYQQRALAHVRKAVAAYPADGHLWLQAGILSFKLKEFNESQAFLEKSRECILSQHVSCVRDLYLARCYDLNQKRDQALQLYRAHQTVQEPKLKKAFQNGVKRQFKVREVARVQVDLQFPDTFQY